MAISICAIDKLAVANYLPSIVEGKKSVIVCWARFCILLNLMRTDVSQYAYRLRNLICLQLVFLFFQLNDRSLAFWNFSLPLHSGEKFGIRPIAILLRLRARAFTMYNQRNFAKLPWVQHVGFVVTKTFVNTFESKVEIRVNEMSYRKSNGAIDFLEIFFFLIQFRNFVRKGRRIARVLTKYVRAYAV